MPQREWARAREELAVTFDRPLDPAERQEQLQAEQDCSSGASNTPSRRVTGFGLMTAAD